MKSPLFFLIVFQLFGSIGFGHPGHVVENNYVAKPILADLNFLQEAGVPVFYPDKKNNLGFAYITPAQEERISMLAHQKGKCAGFQSLEGTEINREKILGMFHGLETSNQKNKLYDQMSIFSVQVTEKPAITQALQSLKIENLKTWVAWLSNYPSRFNKLKEPNKHVDALVDRLKQMFSVSANNPVLKPQVETISHRSTEQKSIRVTIPGSLHPDEIIVLGGHLDSINTSYFGNKAAPGADDNASGSANLLETLRVVLTQAQAERTIEFYWYAGEESGLYGSTEIANAAQAANKKVIAVLQLDMTLFPGEGIGKIGSMTDYTSAWLRNYLKSATSTYLNIQILEGECGYGCSDHASWYNAGYPTIMPFEARLDTMNQNLHSARDVVDANSSFEHSFEFF